MHSTMRFFRRIQSVEMTLMTLAPLAFPRFSLGALKVHMHPAVWHQVPAPSASKQGSLMSINFANTVELTKLSGKHKETKITTERDFSQVSKVNRWLFSRTCISWPYPREIRTCRRTQLRTQSEAQVLPLKIICGAMRAWTCTVICRAWSKDTVFSLTFALTAFDCSFRLDLTW